MRKKISREGEFTKKKFSDIFVSPATTDNGVFQIDQEVLKDAQALTRPPLLTLRPADPALRRTRTDPSLSRSPRRGGDGGGDGGGGRGDGGKGKRKGKKGDGRGGGGRVRSRTPPKKSKEQLFREAVIRACMRKKFCISKNGADSKAAGCKENDADCSFGHKCPFCDKPIPAECQGAMSCAVAQAKVKEQQSE